MSFLTVVLIVAFVAVFIWIIWSDKREWETVYESFADKSKEVQTRYYYLKRQGVQCRLKNYTPGTLRMMGMQGAQMSKQSTIQLQVKRKEADLAFKHLADFNK